MERAEADEHMSEEKNEEAAAPAKAGGSKMLPVLLVMNTLLVGGVLFFVMKKSPAAAVAAKPAEAGEHAPADDKGKPMAGPGPMVKLDNFVIQLRAVDAERYVRVAFDMELGADTDNETVTKRVPHIRDAIISYFSDRTLDELRGSEGMERTKAAILKKLDELVPGRRIRALYITDFIIQ